MEFGSITFIAVDKDNNVYATDTVNCNVQKFTANGTFLTKWGTEGSGDGEFKQPYGIAVDKNDNVVYVTDTDRFSDGHRVQKFTANGTFLAKWGTKGSAGGQFNLPLGIAVDNYGDVFVVDSNNDRIQKFTGDGVFLAMWGVRGEEYGQLYAPDGIAVDNRGNVFVADYINYRIQKFTADGVFLATWGVKGKKNGLFDIPQGVAIG